VDPIFSTVVFAVVLLSSIWLYVDARAIGARRGLLEGLADARPLEWFLASLCLWIFVFPFYLTLRARIRAAAEQATFGPARPQSSSPPDFGPPVATPYTAPPEPASWRSPLPDTIEVRSSAFCAAPVASAAVPELLDVFALSGTLIAEKYRVDAVVGEGGFGVVYRGFHRGLSLPIAIKCLKIPAVLDATGRAQLEQAFAAEAKLLHDLSRSSSAIVQALDIGTTRAPSGEWVPYMVLEWLEGETLATFLARRRQSASVPFSLARVLSLLEPAALALAEAHDRRVAHRDLKPDNLFLAEIGHSTTLKVLDFGIAKVIAETTSLTAALRATGGSLRAFTPQYAAPEQFDQRYGATGPWTDVFAFGLILTELLSGRAALTGNDTIQLMVAAANPAARPTPRALGAEVPQFVEDALARALAVEPAARFPNLRELWSALGRGANPALPKTELTPPPSSRLPSRPVPLAPPRSRSGTPHRYWIALLLPAILVFCVAVERLERHFRTVSAAEGSPSPAVSTAMTAASGNAAPASAESSAASSRREQLAPPSSVAPSPTPPGMVYVPAGTFTMGGDAVAERTVTLTRGFFIDRDETTVADYQRCVSKDVCTPSGVHGAAVTIAMYVKYSSMCNATLEDRPTHPVNCVDIRQAAAYCSFVGKRLPTEAEWEFAARGTDGRRFPWGNEPPTCDRAVRSGCVQTGAHAGTQPVGSRPIGDSPFGVSDLAGNVYEWVWDGWSTPKTEPATDPAIEATGRLGVLKGGSWDFGPNEGAAGHRLKFSCDSSGVSVGFRCAKGGIERAPVPGAQGLPFDCRGACARECKVEADAGSCEDSCVMMCRSQPQSSDTMR
jgi:formylglycine-generating enzyme required for sulfatase activity